MTLDETDQVRLKAYWYEIYTTFTMGNARARNADRCGLSPRAVIDSGYGTTSMAEAFDTKSKGLFRQ
jgi:hypothetical protein